MAGQLPGRPGRDLVTAARLAFTHGLNTAAIGAAIAMIVAALASARFFRGVKVVPDAPAGARRLDKQPEMVR